MVSQSGKVTCPNCGRERTGLLMAFGRDGHLMKTAMCSECIAEMNREHDRQQKPRLK